MGGRGRFLPVNHRLNKYVLPVMLQPQADPVAGTDTYGFGEDREYRRPVYGLRLLLSLLM
jgi:hypothetical protein